jgi:hypothetical protein
MDKIEKTPDELLKEVEAKKATKEAREKYVQGVRDAINAAPTDPNVRIVLRHIMNICGFQTNSVVVGSNGEVQVSSTIYNVGMEAPYHDLRKLMSAETKNAVERSE